MDIKAKLALLKKAADKVEKKYEKRKKPPQESQILPKLPGFEIEQNRYGSVFFREVVHPHKNPHGDVYCREALETPSEVLIFIGQDHEFSRMDINDTVFLDTETTGLAGGSGTVAFLIGCGYFKGRDFVVRQYFMPDYKHEAAMLLHLNGMLEEYSGMVTFNGRTFDAPLIKTRMIMNRIRPPSGDVLHLDLLHPSRRLWKEGIGSCSLTSLERKVLHFYREDDVPGFEIPGMYFDYVRSRDFHSLEIVFDHNFFDIVSMAGLIVKMWEHLEMADCNALEGQAEYYSLGRIYERRGEVEKAAKFYEKALLCNRDSHVKTATRKRLSRIYKKQGKWRQAVAIWTEMTEESLLDPWPYLELAKYHEHREKDYPAALEYASRALIPVKYKHAAAGEYPGRNDVEKIRHRIDRLERKIGMNG